MTTTANTASNATALRAYAISRGTGAQPLLYLSELAAAQRAEELGARITILVPQTTHAEIPVAWAVVCAAGTSLHADHSAAERYAAAMHGTLHPLVAEADIGDKAPRTRSAERMPQGYMTDGGLVRL